MRLRASFAHPHRTPVQHGSIECCDSALGFRRLRHFHEGYAARFARIPVVDDGDAVDAAVDCKKVAQLLLRHRDIEIPDKDVGHELILF